MVRLIARWLAAAKELRGVRGLRKARFERFFRSPAAYSAMRGVFRSFDEARALAPPQAPLGFDLPAFGDEYQERLDQVYDYDYPVLFWLSRLLRPGLRLFDVGGHVGIHFYAYQRLLPFPEGLRWTVCDVPAVAEKGRQRAREQGETRIDFVSEFQAADGTQVLISAGAIQYMQAPELPAILRGLARKPTHVLVNKLPLYDGPPFVTLQNAGVSFVPLHVFNRSQFVQGMQGVGYELVDAWDNPGRRCHIPFHPERSFPAMSGLYFRAVGGDCRRAGLPGSG